MARLVLGAVVLALLFPAAAAARCPGGRLLSRRGRRGALAIGPRGAVGPAMRRVRLRG